MQWKVLLESGISLVRAWLGDGGLLFPVLQVDSSSHLSWPYFPSNKKYKFLILFSVYIEKESKGKKTSSKTFPLESTAVNDKIIPLPSLGELCIPLWDRQAAAHRSHPAVERLSTSTPTNISNPPRLCGGNGWQSEWEPHFNFPDGWVIKGWWEYEIDWSHSGQSPEQMFPKQWLTRCQWQPETPQGCWKKASGDLHSCWIQPSHLYFVDTSAI